MSTRKKSKAIRTLEKLAGREFKLGGLMESLRLSEAESLASFSKKLNISASHLCDIEKGRKAISPSRASEFAKILGRSQSQFVRLAIQEELDRAGLNYKVSLETA